MSDDGWEARMAEKAAARSLIRAAEEITLEAAERHEAQPTIDAYIDAYPMTVEQAREASEPPPGMAYSCACLGPPAEIRDLPGAPCWCAVIAEKVRRLLEAADGP